MADILKMDDKDRLARIVVRINNKIMRLESLGQFKYSGLLRERADFVRQRLEEVGQYGKNQRR